MESVYKNMQPCPNQKDHMHYRPYYYPGMEAIPPQMHMNSPRPPVGYEWWPWGGNYGGAPPSACHGCCNHSYFPPQCGWGSPCTHVPQHHCPGNYPSFPVQYMAPPPFYAMGQPRYEYEKNNVPREHHCCGCSNHPFHDKEQKSVRIEEEEPERDRRGFDSLIPFRAKNSTDPVVWIPPDHSGKKEQVRVNNMGDRSDAKVEHPAFWNGWHPLDLNSLASVKNRGDGEENNQHGDGNRNLPFPLFWIPYKPEEKDGEKHKIKDGNATPSLELEKGSGGEQNVHQNRENTGDQAAVKLREIPVKEVARHVEKESSKYQEKERNGGEKKVEKGTSRKSTSPTKTSKLPPVCLRVDPLPRRKNGNGTSQPNDARKVVKSSETKEQAKSLHNEHNKTKEQAKSLHNEHNKDKSAKTIDVVDGRTSNADNTDVKVDILTNQAEEKPREAQVSQNHAEDDAVVKSQSEDAGSTKSKNEGVQEKKLSEEEAAVVIQSAYRGYDVRKWEIIKKLKEIAKVREQMGDVERLIQAMKSSSDGQSRSKQRNVIAETIMGLLLKLDTIQGVHPSIRADRKSVVKELVSLQEQLDLLMNEQPENPPGQESIMTHGSEDVSSSQDGNETNTTHENPIDGGSNHESSEVSETDPVRETAIERFEKEAAESVCNNGVESASAPTVEEDEKSNVVLENERAIPKEDKEDLVLGEASELSSLENGDSAMAAPVPTVEQDEKSNGVESASVPTGEEDEKSNEVLENGKAIPKEDNKDLVLGEASEISSLEKDDSAKAAPVPTIEQDDESDHLDQGTELLSQQNDDSAKATDESPELPIGVIDDFSAKEGSNDEEVEADASKADQAKQSDEASIESSESHEIDSNQTVETQEVSDLPLNRANVGSDTQETCPRPLNDESDDVRIEPDECIAEQPTEPSEASEEVEICTCSKDNTELTPQSVVTKINDSEVACKQDQPEAIEEVYNTEQGSYEENVADPTTEKNSTARDEVTERNRILIEENERLRDMMERLIKSGQEQLTAISSLSGRVKDLEKKLSRKKKLKLKQHRNPKSDLHA